MSELPIDLIFMAFRAITLTFQANKIAKIPSKFKHQLVDYKCLRKALTFY
jgi:hypothetical protein